MSASHCPEVDSRWTTKYEILKFWFIVGLIYIFNLLFICIFGCPPEADLGTVWRQHEGLSKGNSNHKQIDHSHSTVLCSILVMSSKVVTSNNVKVISLTRSGFESHTSHMGSGCPTFSASPSYLFKMYLHITKVELVTSLSVCLWYQKMAGTQTHRTIFVCCFTS